MAEYNKYIFDIENRLFVGQFEKMYQQEKSTNFDSWHQEDSRQLNRKTALNILDVYNFNRIIDLGCGKGMLTHHLKRNNNTVLGIDISPTALGIARTRFPDINFAEINLNDCSVFERYINQYYGTVET